MIGHSFGPTVMMQLGAFQFSIDTAAYQELTRRSEYRWASQDRFGQEPNLQFTGPATETISLSGIIYPDYKGGSGQLIKMRALAGSGKPMNLVGGAGSLLGRWVIESLEEKQSVFAAAGVARKQEFTLQLKKFPGTGANPASSAAEVATAGTTTSSLGSFADSAMATIGAATGAMTSALEEVQSFATELSNAVGPVIATVQYAIRTGRDLESQFDNLKEASKNLNSLENIQSAIFAVKGTASAATNASSLAANAANLLGISLTKTPPSPEAIAAVRSCTIACGNSAVVSTRAYADTDAINKSQGT